MMFSLTCELIDEIISAMENQEKKFAVNAKKNELVEISSVFLQNFSVDEENFYCLPEWRPADGFSLREEFVNQLHSPLAHDELQNVLHSGRGVFKSFRNVLKNFLKLKDVGIFLNTELCLCESMNGTIICVKFGA